MFYKGLLNTDKRTYHRKTPASVPSTVRGGGGGGKSEGGPHHPVAVRGSIRDFAVDQNLILNLSFY